MNRRAMLPGTSRPRTALLLLFLSVVVAPALMLVWFGWRQIESNRASELRRVAEQRDGVAQLVVATLEQRLAAVRQSLALFDSPETLPGHVALLDRDRVRIQPEVQLPYYPFPDHTTDAPSSPFEEIERTEYAGRDLLEVANEYSELARTGDNGTRAGALLRQARVLRKAGKPEEALNLYSELSDFPGVTFEGVPAALAAIRARCTVFAQMGENEELQLEAQELQRQLQSRQWSVERAVYELYRQDIEQWAPSLNGDRSQASEPIAEALDWLWQGQYGGSLPNEGQAASEFAGESLTVVWKQGPDGLMTWISEPAEIVQAWLGDSFPSYEIRLLPEDSGPVGGPEVTLTPAVLTGLPWNVAVANADLEAELADLAGRRRLEIAGLMVIVLFVAAGSYFLIRAYTRELAVAKIQSDFVSAVSHEFRTPLASLRQISENLAEGRGGSPESLQGYYQALVRSTERLSHLVESLLDFGRMESGRQSFRMETLDLVGWLRELASDFSSDSSYRDYRLEIQTEVASGAPKALVKADPALLTRAVRNLLENAARYSPDCHTIWLTLRREGGNYAISVRDKGVGIPVAEQESIFGKFVRGEYARASGVRGTGIGLAMVRHIVTAHKGSVELKSAPGEGSTFTVLLPVEA